MHHRGGRGKREKGISSSTEKRLVFLLGLWEEKGGGRLSSLLLLPLALLPEKGGGGEGHYLRLPEGGPAHPCSERKKRKRKRAALAPHRNRDFPKVVAGLRQKGFRCVLVR